MTQRAAHANVVERRQRVVDRQYRLALGRADRDVEPVMLSKLLDVLRRRIVGKAVEVTRH